jgi:hypothetical protein
MAAADKDKGSMNLDDVVRSTLQDFVANKWAIPQPQLTPAHFEAIGRLAVGFNRIEELMIVFTRWLLEIREPEIACSLSRGSFNRESGCIGRSDKDLE